MFTNDFLQFFCCIHSLWIEQSMFTKCEFFIPCSFNIKVSNMLMTSRMLHLTCLIMHMFVKWTICTRHEFSPYSFNISMWNMVIMHIWHLKLIWETLCWFAHLDVKWTIYHWTLENLFDMLMSICTMCVDVKWTTCSLNRNFLSMSIQHVLTFDKMSNKQVEWTSLFYLCQKGCIIGGNIFLMVKICQKSNFEIKNLKMKWFWNFSIAKSEGKIVKNHQIRQLVFSV
jgi:hypothetical protein